MNPSNALGSNRMENAKKKKKKIKVGLIWRARTNLSTVDKGNCPDKQWRSRDHDWCSSVADRSNDTQCFVHRKENGSLQLRLTVCGMAEDRTRTEGQAARGDLRTGARARRG